MAMVIGNLQNAQDKWQVWFHDWTTGTKVACVRTTTSGDFTRELPYGKYKIGVYHPDGNCWASSPKPFDWISSFPLPLIVVAPCVEDKNRDAGACPAGYRDEAEGEEAEE
jgi:hypothetical protein